MNGDNNPEYKLTLSEKQHLINNVASPVPVRNESTMSMTHRSVIKMAGFLIWVVVFVCVVGLFVFDAYKPILSKIPALGEMLNLEALSKEYKTLLGVTGLLGLATMGMELLGEKVLKKQLVIAKTCGAAAKVVVCTCTLLILTGLSRGRLVGLWAHGVFWIVLSGLLLGLWVLLDLVAALIFPFDSVDLDQNVQYARVPDEKGKMHHFPLNKTTNPKTLSRKILSAAILASWTVICLFPANLIAFTPMFSFNLEHLIENVVKPFIRILTDATALESMLMIGTAIFGIWTYISTMKIFSVFMGSMWAEVLNEICLRDAIILSGKKAFYLAIDIFSSGVIYFFSYALSLIMIPVWGLLEVVLTWFISRSGNTNRERMTAARVFASQLYGTVTLLICNVFMIFDLHQYLILGTFSLPTLMKADIDKHLATQVGLASRSMAVLCFVLMFCALVALVYLIYTMNRSSDAKNLSTSLANPNTDSTQSTENLVGISAFVRKYFKWLYLLAIYLFIIIPIVLSTFENRQDLATERNQERAHADLYQSVPQPPANT
ncbi:hypothetical protein NEDG_00011 [Nematocida displodere]|uniref:Uncharacterized protein n=1 Tax=Nematocida displodere TaxID=1805483 RepID=A0A177EII9_9MICR|nr:hypothetical protein NEDG_00011 [Nematocida displodere]